MSKRPAPPGRKGSVKRETFKSEDTSDVTAPAASVETPATQQPAPKNSSSDEQLADRRRQEEEALKREIEARRQREMEETAAIRRAQEAQYELEEQLRLTRLEQENLRLAQQDIAQEREEVEANRRRLERGEQDDDQKKRNGAETERTRAERLRLETMALAEAEEATRLAAAALQADAEAARREAFALAAARQAEAEAAAVRQAEAKAAAVRQAEAEAAALAEEKRRQEQDELARQKRKAEREAERQRLIEEHQRKLQEEEEAEKAAIAAVEAEERLKAEAERARLKAQQQAEAQRLLDEEEAELAEVRRKAAEQRKKRANFLSDMDSFSTQFVSQTAEKESRLQDAERKKEALRENIATLPAKPVDAPRVRKNNASFEEEEVKTNIVEEPIYVAPATVTVAPTAQRTIVVDKDSAQRSQATLSSLADNLFNSSSAAAAASSVPAPASVSAPAPTSNRDAFVPDNTVYGSTNVVGDEELRMPTKIGGANKQSKAASKGAAMAATAATAASSDAVDTKRASASMPAARPGYTPPPSATSGSTTPTTPTVAPIVPTGRGVVVVNNEDEDDDEEEGAGALNSISNILTREERRRMTMAEKASWKAKQADLNTRRKDFHGAVTYMFDGIFSWQMYGSAEALDEFGNTYTEYLMRCQWGTSFDNLQPWIVAHRYREFDRLDQEFRKRFPALEATMPRLPKKEFFWSMETNVVSKRRQDLEEYMVKIVQSMPSFMRSDLLDNFLNITERIGTIKTLLNVQSSISLQRTVDTTSAAADHAYSSGAVGHAVRRDSTRGHAEEAYANAAETQTDGFVSSSSSSILGSDPLGVSTGTGGHQRRGSSSRGGPTVVDEDEDREARLAASQPDPSVFYWTVDEAEEAKEALHAQPMVEDELGRLEEDIRSFYLILRSAKGGHASEIVAPQSSARRLSQAINQRWPRLRATAVVNLAADFVLIPRAMQAEEDYVRCLQEFRNLEVLQGYAI